MPINAPSFHFNPLTESEKFQMPTYKNFAII